MKVNDIMPLSESQLTLGEFPIAKAALATYGPKASITSKFDGCRAIILSAIEAKEIINTDFDAVKYYVNMFVDYAYEAAVQTVYTWNQKYLTLPEELQYLDFPSEARGVKSFSKKIDKLSKVSKETEMFKAARALTDELMNLNEVMEYLKSVAVKASVKKAQVKAAVEAEEVEYNKKFTSHKDVKKIIDLFNTKSADIEKKLFNARLDYFNKVVANYVAAVEKTGKTDPREVFGQDGFSLMVMQRLVKYEGRKVYSLATDWKESIKHDAAQSAASVVAKFTHKSAGKLSFILYTKNNMKTVELHNVSTSLGSIECDIHVVFEDGSQFVANSSVVLSYSKLGKPFYRFPMIFQSVKLPDGKRLASPSEQKMDEVFALAK